MGVQREVRPAKAVPSTLFSASGHSAVAVFFRPPSDRHDLRNTAWQVGRYACPESPGFRRGLLFE